MDKRAFADLFHAALDVAARNAEQRLGRRVSRHFQVRLYGAGYAGELLDPETAVDALYLGEDLFYRIIDVAVVEVSARVTACFARASDHRPGTFDQTWNQPPGSGPFKQLIAEDIKVVNDG